MAELIVGGMTTYIDEDMLYLTKEWIFKLQEDDSTYYIRLAKGKNRQELLHRIIMKEKGHNIENYLIDHKDRNGLNNLYSNLRLVNKSQSAMNKSVYRNNRSGYKGVSYRVRSNMWEANINYNKQSIYLGAFKKIEDAARAYNRAAKIYHKEFAVFNDVDPLF